MRRFFIDYTNGALGNSNVKYHGGGDFCRFILRGISEYSRNNEVDYDVNILWPNLESVISKDERDIVEKYTISRIDSLLDIAYEEGDVLFLPLIDVFSLSIIRKLKKKFPKLKIYCVLHGVRLFDVQKYDKYDRYYYSGIKSLPCVLWGRRWLAGIIARVNMKKCIPLVDRVYTVSNNSMQRICQYAKPQYIKYFTRNIAIHEEYNKDEQKAELHRFALFVNANRYEKNFIRTLIAFCSYKKESNSDLRLYVLGMSSNVKNNIRKVKEVDWNIVESSVVFKDYVDGKHLCMLYSECEFLLYTSKSEGFGLPPLEAMEAGRPTVASSLTSVPEVLGMAAYYVNPYDVQDIEKGIRYMDNKNNQEKYVKMFDSFREASRLKGKNDVEILIAELLSESI